MYAVHFKNARFFIFSPFFPFDFGANKRVFKHCTPHIMVSLASFTTSGPILIRIWRQSTTKERQELHISKCDKNLSPNRTSFGQKNQDFRNLHPRKCKIQWFSSLPLKFSTGSLVGSSIRLLYIAIAARVPSEYAKCSLGVCLPRRVIISTRKCSERGPISIEARIHGESLSRPHQRSSTEFSSHLLS